MGGPLVRIHYLFGSFPDPLIALGAINAALEYVQLFAIILSEPFIESLFNKLRDTRRSPPVLSFGGFRGGLVLSQFDLLRTSEQFVEFGFESGRFAQPAAMEAVQVLDGGRHLNNFYDTLKPEFPEALEHPFAQCWAASIGFLVDHHLIKAINVFPLN